MLDLWFSEASQNLSSFRQLLFSLFHSILKSFASNFLLFPKEKIKKTMRLGGILNFSLWSPLWNNENKSCLNKLKFWQASENHKSSTCWKFQLSNQKSAKMPEPGPRWSGPYDLFFTQNEEHFILGPFERDSSFFDSSKSKHSSDYYLSLTKDLWSKWTE